MAWKKNGFSIVKFICVNYNFAGEKHVDSNNASFEKTQFGIQIWIQYGQIEKNCLSK